MLFPVSTPKRRCTTTATATSTPGWAENSLYEGMGDAIRQLHLQGFTIALCTSKPRVFAEKIIDHFDLTRYFDGIHGPEFDGRFDHKTDLLAHLIGHYKVAPVNAVMIGDRDKGCRGRLARRGSFAGRALGIWQP